MKGVFYIRSGDFIDVVLTRPPPAAQVDCDEADIDEEFEELVLYVGDGYQRLVGQIVLVGEVSGSSCALLVHLQKFLRTE